MNSSLLLMSKCSPTPVTRSKNALAARYGVKMALKMLMYYIYTMRFRAVLPCLAHA
jgi:hypothetical protein